MKAFLPRIRKFFLCSDCFGDQGLRLDAERIGFSSRAICPNCSNRTGKKLDGPSLFELTKEFFVNGTRARTFFGSAPLVQFNERQPTSVQFSGQLHTDAALLARALGVGFFHYGPRLWMIGEIEPLNELQDEETQAKVIDRILTSYPEIELSPGELLYRMRTNLSSPGDAAQYDGQPLSIAGSGRLD